jgi:hypothetical protein
MHDTKHSDSFSSHSENFGNVFRSFFNVVSLTPKFSFIFGGWRTFDLRKISKNIFQIFLVRKEI